MIHNMPALGIRFDIGKINSSIYGFECWKVFWQNIDIKKLSGALLFEGDTRATLNHREDVFCIAIQGIDSAVLREIRAILEQSPEFQKMAATPKFVEGGSVIHEPLPAAGHIDSAGNLLDGFSAKSALDDVMTEKEPTSQSSSISASESIKTSGITEDFSIKEERNHPSKKSCPYCMGEIQDEAIKCKHCHKWLSEGKTSSEPISFSGVIGSENKNRTYILNLSQSNKTNNLSIRMKRAFSSDRKKTFLIIGGIILFILLLSAFIQRLQGGEGELTIVNNYAQNVSVALSSKSIFSFIFTEPNIFESAYIRSGKSFTITDIPDGTYILYYSRNNKQYRFKDEIEFITTGNNPSLWEITLNAKDGNSFPEEVTNSPIKDTGIPVESKNDLNLFFIYSTECRKGVFQMSIIDEFEKIHSEIEVKKVQYDDLSSDQKKVINDAGGYPIMIFNTGDYMRLVVGETPINNLEEEYSAFKKQTESSEGSTITTGSNNTC